MQRILFLACVELLLTSASSAQYFKLQATLKGHDDLCIAFCPNSTTLVSGGLDGINLWDVATGKNTATFKENRGPVNSVAFSPNGKALASGNWDHTITLWDVKTGKVRASIKGHASVVNSVAFSPDGKTLASGSYDRTIRLWNVKMGKEASK